MSWGPTFDAVGGSTFHCDYVDFGWNENERMDWGIELDGSCWWFDYIDSSLF